MILSKISIFAKIDFQAKPNQLSHAIRTTVPNGVLGPITLTVPYRAVLAQNPVNAAVSIPKIQSNAREKASKPKNATPILVQLWASGANFRTVRPRAEAACKSARESANLGPTATEIR